jgi:hypothetical protein
MSSPLPQVEVHITQLQDWLDNTAEANSTLSTSRNWCTLDLTGFTEQELQKTFDRAELGKAYKAEKAKTSGRAPFALWQLESDLILGLHKCMAARHRGRLMMYRDDCAQKKYHTFSAISLGLGKHKGFSNHAQVISGLATGKIIH